MRICDLSPDKIRIGLRVKGLSTGKLGTITRIDYSRDNLVWIKWDNEEIETSGFYGNDCECEVIND